MLNINEMKWDNANKLTIAGDHKISEIEILFKKLDDKIINELKNKTTNPMNLEELFK